MKSIVYPSLISVNSYLLLSLLLLLWINVSYAQNSGFPGRNIYSQVPVIELNELYKKIKNVVVVDVRSQYEYDTLKIKGAINIPISNSSFAKKIKELRETTDKPIVFYCNGRTCFKSYKAVKKAMTFNVKNCFSYDAGIFDWARKYPDYAELLGKNPIKVNDLISIQKFRKRLLTPEEFSSKVGKSSIVLDVRESFQRDAIGFFPGFEHRVTLDQKNKLQDYVIKAKLEHKTLLIYDAVGKQVRWLQYFLEASGSADYYFMRNGAKGYYDMLTKLQFGIGMNK